MPEIIFDNCVLSNFALIKTSFFDYTRWGSIPDIEGSRCGFIRSKQYGVA